MDEQAVPDNGDVDHVLDARLPRCRDERSRLGLIALRRTREVEDRPDANEGRWHAFAGGQVGTCVLPTRLVAGESPSTEDADPLPGAGQASDNEPAQRAGAAGDQDPRLARLLHAGYSAIGSRSSRLSRSGSARMSIDTIRPPATVIEPTANGRPSGVQATAPGTPLTSARVAVSPN
jgi:hypothetical protein